MAQIGANSRQVRGAIALALVFFLAVGGLAASVATRADAAPSAVIGPVESFTATVVPGTIVVVGPVVRFNAERPAIANPATLEQLVVETVQGALVIPSEILSITGNYDTDTKIFKATSMTSLGNAAPARSSSRSSGSSGGDDNDNGGGGDDDDDNDNGGGNNDDNDNGGGCNIDD
ncbi:MAG: hypothetical protein ACKVVP_24460, partial [Chloroflexota bacterium]